MAKPNKAQTDPEYRARAAAGADYVQGLVAKWQTARALLRVLEEAEHPDLVDVDGRVWTWWKADLYTTPRPDLYPIGPGRTEVGRAAWPRHLIRER